MAEQTGDHGSGGLLADLPIDHLKQGFQDLALALAERAATSLSGKLEGVTDRLSEAVDNGGGLLSAVFGNSAKGLIAAPFKAAAGSLGGVKDQLGKAAGAVRGGGETDRAKVVNIVEQIDVGLPISVAYNQWTEFEKFPSFTRKVNDVEQVSDEEISWQAQIFLSHRSWDSQIIEQIPDERIVWTSKGAKGTVDGSVTFHELAPSLTKILLVLEYHPKGLFEKTANLWRAQGRRVRSDFKHIERHMMTRTILEQEKVRGWRGEIRDGEVVQTHEEALDAEEEQYGSEESEDREMDYGDEGSENENQGYDEAEQDEAADEDEELSGERARGRRERSAAGRRG